MKITIDVLDKRSIAKGISDLKSYKKDLRKKADELCEKLAEYGADVVGTEYSSVEEWVSKSGNPDFSIEVLKRRKGYTIQATGEDVLFLEFGSGATYGDTHTDYADSEGMVVEGGNAPYGPGSYPEGKGHWNDPNGWYVMHNVKSYGNPATAGMYTAKAEMERKIKEFAKEIFDG